MAITAKISSSFVIVATQDSAAAQTVTITNSGRAFTVQYVEIEWNAFGPQVNGSAVQLARVTSGGVATNLFSSPDYPLGIKGSRTVVPVWEPDTSAQNTTWAKPTAAADFSATDNIRLTTSGGDTQVTVTLHCIANPSQSLTVT